MIRVTRAVVGLFALLCLLPSLAHAQTPVAVTYPAGWSMVGAPSGASYGSARALYLYGAAGYMDAPNRISSACTGYWANFAAPTTVILPSTGSLSSQVCPVTAGWTLLGNPFSYTATLPAGTVAYLFDPVTQQYQSTTSIPAGSAAWVYSASAGTVALHTTPPPTTIVISGPYHAASYTIHVGDQIRVELSANATVQQYAVASTSPTLRLVDAGFTQILSCTGDPTCVLTPGVNFWTFAGSAPGTAAIVLTPICAATASCSAFTESIPVTILP